MSEEIWATILDFPDYEISNHGRVYNNRMKRMMSTSQTQWGHVKISLFGLDGIRHTRSVAQMVAEAFVEPPNYLCNEVVVLDGDISNVTAENLVWRSKRFAWFYSRQMKSAQPEYFTSFKVVNVNTGVEYDNIIHAGISEGLLFRDIMRSVHTGDPIFPVGAIFGFVKQRV